MKLSANISTQNISGTTFPGSDTFSTSEVPNEPKWSMASRQGTVQTVKGAFKGLKDYLGRQTMGVFSILYEFKKRRSWWEKQREMLQIQAARRMMSKRRSSSMT